MPWLWETKVETNDTPNSQKVINLKALKFDELWNSYPKDTITHSGVFIKGVGFVEDGYSDHCAINISEALITLGIKIKAVHRNKKCDGKCNRPKQHVLGAENLADWLSKKPFPNCPKVQKFTGTNFEKNVDGKTGIIFFKDYWQRNIDEKGNRTGDHIDLWNENELASKGYLETSFLLATGSILDTISYEIADTIENNNVRRSDYKKSKEVWFWEIK
jgi:hypothetical protein